MYWKLVKGIYFMIVLLFLVEHGTTRQRQEKMRQRCDGVWVYDRMNMDETYLPTQTKSCCLQYLINLFNKILNKKVKNETFIIENFVLSNPLVTQEKLWGGIDQNKSFHFKFQAMKRNFYHLFLTLLFKLFLIHCQHISGAGKIEDVLQHESGPAHLSRSTGGLQVGVGKSVYSGSRHEPLPGRRDWEPLMQVPPSWASLRWIPTKPTPVTLDKTGDQVARGTTRDYALSGFFLDPGQTHRLACGWSPSESFLRDAWAHEKLWTACVISFRVKHTLKKGCTRQALRNMRQKDMVEC